MTERPHAPTAAELEDLFRPDDDLPVREWWELVADYVDPEVTGDE